MIEKQAKISLTRANLELVKHRLKEIRRHITAKKGDLYNPNPKRYNHYVMGYARDSVFVLSKLTELVEGLANMSEFLITWEEITSVYKETRSDIHKQAIKELELEDLKNIKLFFKMKTRDEIEHTKRWLREVNLNEE